MVEDNRGVPGTAETVAMWEEQLGLTWITVGDPDSEWVATWHGEDGTSHRSFTVLNARGAVTWKLHDGSPAGFDEIIDALNNAF